MACSSDITAGRGKVCKGLGGASSIYVYNNVDDAFTYSASTGLATAINASLTTVFEFEIEGDLSTYASETTTDENTGTSFVTHTLTLSLNQMDAATSATFNLLAKGRAGAVVKDRNGNYLVVGVEEGLNWAGSTQTGGARGDQNGYTITATAQTADLAPILDSATETAFLLLVA